jgi:hypothetical protein
MRSIACGALGTPRAYGVAARGERVDVLALETVREEQRAGVGERVRRALVDDRVRGQELGLRHVDIDAEPLGQPRRVAEVVGVVVRRDDTRQGRTGHRRREVALPQGARRVGAVAESTAV